MTNITSLTDRQAARRGERGTEALVAGAAAGEPQAWSQLIDRYAVLIRSVCRAHRLADADGAGVGPLTMPGAVEHIGRLRDPDRFGAWIATTARHECLRVLRGGRRLVPTADEIQGPLFAAHAAASAALRVRSELRRDRIRAPDARREHRADPRPRPRAASARAPARDAGRREWF